MDDPNLDARRHRHALRGLARVNAISLSTRTVWKPIRRLAKELGTSRLRVLDVATGGGDIPLGIWKRSRRANLDLEITGVDISAEALAVARQRCEEKSAVIDFQQLDVFAEPLPDGYDVVVSSLFLHHLSEEDAAVLLSKMAKATRHSVLVNDLVRSRLNLVLVFLAMRLLTTSKVVHTDGPLSVKAAFTREEARGLAVETGLDTAIVRRRFPCRYLLEWRSG